MLRKGGVTLRSMLARQTTGWPVSRGGQYENSGLFITPGSIGAQSRVLRERWMKGNGAEIIETIALGPCWRPSLRIISHLQQAPLRIKNSLNFATLGPRMLARSLSVSPKPLLNPFRESRSISSPERSQLGPWVRGSPSLWRVCVPLAHEPQLGNVEIIICPVGSNRYEHEYII